MTLEQRFPLVGVVASESGEDYSHLIASMKRQRASDLRRVAEMLETALRGIQTTRKGDGSMLSLGETMTLFGRIADQLRAMSEVQ